MFGIREFTGRPGAEIPGAATPRPPSKKNKTGKNPGDRTDGLPHKYSLVDQLIMYIERRYLGATAGCSHYILEWVESMVRTGKGA